LKVGIFGNIQKPEFWKIFPTLTDWLNKNNVEIHLMNNIIENEFHYLKSNKFQNFNSIIKTKDFNKIDFLIALGGDGTILSASRNIGKSETPIFGVHLGSLGFLAESKVENLYNNLKLILKNKNNIFPRMIAQAVLKQNNKKNKIYALNDLVINSIGGTRLISCSLFLDGKYITSYSADGLIIATPTGSTAYNLSAGGPIIAPWLSLFTITPICPHSLSSRPIVLSGNSNLKITFPNNESLNLSADGQVNFEIKSGSELIISKSPHFVNMITLEENDYFDTLRTKMGWGQKKINNE
tara:strand:+ start:346 stop:1233 length:888 start_codon:yes stop_codon:yes gene_type:complete